MLLFYMIIFYICFVNIFLKIPMRMVICTQMELVDYCNGLVDTMPVLLKEVRLYYFSFSNQSQKLPLLPQIAAECKFGNQGQKPTKGVIQCSKSYWYQLKTSPIRSGRYTAIKVLRTDTFLPFDFSFPSVYAVKSNRWLLCTSFAKKKTRHYWTSFFLLKIKQYIKNYNDR